MRRYRIGTFGVLAIMCFTAARGADQKGKFSPGPASSYPTKQTNDQVTIAAVPYDSEELAHSAFGKVNPNQYGVLPVLIIIQNDTNEALRMESIQLEYEQQHGGRIEPTPMEDVKYVGGASPRPPQAPTGPLPKIFKKKVNPLNTVEIPERAFAARMLPPHESASGFFYFQAHRQPGDKIYITGLNGARSGKGIVYFEIPFDH